jgi:hypothetical protein
MVNILYKEEQKIWKNPVWLFIILAPVLFFWYVLCYQLITGELVGDKPIQNLPLSVITIVYSTIAIWCLGTIKLSIVLDQETLFYGWNVPTADLNSIRINDIQEWSLIKYKFVGYGYRLSRQYGTVYNAKGNRGLQVIKKSGEKILIGTSNEEDLKEVISKISLS